MEASAIQPYDIFMVAILVLATMFGAYKGMAWQLASIASLVLSTMVAIHCSGPLAPMVSVEAPWNRFIAMLILFLITSMTVWVIFRVVAGAIDRVQLREFDRQIGALFGLAKGVLLCLVITFFAVTLSEPARQSVLKARSGYYIALLIRRAAPVLPEEVRGVLGEYIDELDRKLDPSTPPDEDQPTEQRVASQSRPSDTRRAGQDMLKSPYSRDFSPITTEHKKHYRTLSRGPASGRLRLDFTHMFYERGTIWFYVLQCITYCR